MPYPPAYRRVPTDPAPRRRAHNEPSRPPVQGVGGRCQAVSVDDTPTFANAISPQGRTVEVTERRWAYVQHHAEMRGELELLLTAITPA